MCNLKPAGIKTIREAIERLLDGEVFYSPDGCEIRYDDSNIACGSGRVNPFIIIEPDGSCEPINLLWKRVSSWQIEYKWEDDIGDGVLCWVSDCNRIPCKHDYLRLITAYDLVARLQTEVDPKVLSSIIEKADAAKKKLEAAREALELQQTVHHQRTS